MKVTDLHGYPIEGDLTREVETLPGAVALDLDGLYRGWKKGMTSSIIILIYYKFFGIGIAVFKNRIN
ncbi:MAG: hypothetical protein KFF68_01455, partial [Desulfosarcina sp.]|nr:hypothetical protein [Desulfosarcina sp.]